jgi:hypothetical protein
MGMYRMRENDERVTVLPNGDKQHGCGCVTFWLASRGALYRKACGSHKRYAERCGILVQDTGSRHAKR